jgi:2-oxoglutarate ferredoxin oxidoreductase subunit alpha
VATDLDIGMNDWMVKRLEWDDAYRPDRGKVLDAAALEKLKRFSRYLDVDGDGIAARTLPGVGAKGAYFVRGSGHDKHAAYTEDSAAYMEVVDRLRRKFAHAATLVPKPAVTRQKGADIGLVTIGGCDAAVREAADRLREQEILVDVMRIRGFPFGEEVREFLEAYESVFVVEQNRDGQLRGMLMNECSIDPAKLMPVLHYDGTPVTARFIAHAIEEKLALFNVKPLRKVAN